MQSLDRTFRRRFYKANRELIIPGHMCAYLISINGIREEIPIRASDDIVRTIDRLA